MKKTIGWIICLALVLFCAAAFADVQINEITFPDSTFRSYVAENFDTNGNWVLSDAELSEVTEIDCADMEIATLRGVEYFPNLKTLLCFYCGLTELDVSNNTALVKLWCYCNSLKTLNLSNNKALQNVSCHTNRLSALDVSNNRALRRLVCSCNQFRVLDIRNIPALIKLVREVEPELQEFTDYAQLAWILDDEAGTGLRLTIDPLVRLIYNETDQTDISEAAVSPIPDQVYSGKALKPGVTVELDGEELTRGVDYTVSYKNNKQVGTATVTVTGKGSYTGKITASFRINPKGVKLSSLTAGKKSLTVKWKKGSNISGYQIEYSLKKNFKSSKKITVSDASAVSRLIKNLKAGTLYYVRIRTFKTVKSVKYYSAWSAAKSLKTKK